jgi:hypothetical protein
MESQTRLPKALLWLLCILLTAGCSNDDNGPDPMDPGPNPTPGDSTIYSLVPVSNPDISGTATFIENSDNTVTVELELQNTTAGGQHPAHIHLNTAVEGGGIVITLGTVDGSTGLSSITISSQDDGTPITYDELLEFDGYINVHQSTDDLGTLLAQGDIGQNKLTGTSKTYMLGPVTDPDISGTAIFEERMNGEALATIQLNNTLAGGSHPSHIHSNTAAEGGGIVFTFNPINGDTGSSKTNVAALDDDTPFGYDDVLEVDGYINVHMSAEDLGTLLAQGDIGQNELTGTSKTYVLGPVTDPDISGTATFEERLNGEALATIQLNNTLAGGSHPSHIHNNTAAEGGGIAFTFTPINGDTGGSKTNVAALDDDTPFGYADVLEVDGYINVHLSAEDLGTLLAQGDIGQNELTGTFTEYPLGGVSDPDIEGSATFFERVNGEALAVIDLVNTTPGASHPAHIHNNSAAEGGDIAFTFIPVSGDNGTSRTNVAALDDATSFGYDDVLVFDGYINVHLSEADLGTLVAQGDIGSNVDSGDSEAINYDVTNNGLVSYVFNGNGLSDSENPDLSLVRGQTYTFTVNASGHPFFIKSVQGNSNANAYNNGVTNNGTQSGTITFEVPMDAPDILYYNCQFHEVMTGQINITD